MQSRLLLDVVVGQSPSVLELLPCKDQSLLVRRDSLLVLDLALDSVDGVGALYLERDGLASESLDKDLHDCVCKKEKQEGDEMGMPTCTQHVITIHKTHICSSKDTEAL